MLTESMTQEMMNEWVKLVSKSPYSSVEKFTTLLEFLRDWRSRLEYMGAGIRAASDDEKRKDGQQTTNNDTSGRRSGFGHHAEEKDRNTGGSKRTRCWLHKVEGEAGDHPIWSRKGFLRKKHSRKARIGEGEQGMLQVSPNNLPWSCRRK